MYNANRPNPDSLPTTKQLIKSTIIAVASAVFILVTIIMPAEYAIDPTGIGGVLGLTEKGEIKMQLQEEAEEDHSRLPASGLKPQANAGVLDQLFAGLFIAPANAQSTWTDEVKITLTRGQGAEVKLVMKEGDKAEFSWVSENGKANFDLHGDGGGQSISYEKGRGVPGGEGTLMAAFDGNHGWFWRNRDKRDITIVLRVRGAYSDIKKYF